MKERGPLFLIGIDSVPLWILQKLRNEKGMEGFSKLLEKKLITNLESTTVPLTAPAWSSMYTGMKPYQHGVPEFLVITKDYVPDITKFDSHKYMPFYYKLAENGLKCLVITPAMDTDLPPENLSTNLELMTGFPMKAKANSEMLNKLMKRHNFYGEPDIEKYIDTGKKTYNEAVDEYALSARKRAKIAEEMIESNDYDFVYVCFTETDRVMHFFMDKSGATKYTQPIYAEVSSFISFVMRYIDKHGGALMIVSDHGAQPIKKEFMINGWMVKNGYATLKESILNAIDEGNAKSGKNSVKYRIREAIFKSWLRDLYERAPYHIKKFTFNVMGALSSYGNEAEGTRILPSDFDMGKTKAFGAISILPVSSIWINDSRFSRGIVSEKEKGKIKMKLMNDLKGIKDESGNSLVARVIDGNKYYMDTKKFIPPDVMFEVKEGYTIDPYRFSKTSLFMNPIGPKNGDHTKFGIFGLYTEEDFDVKKKNLSVFDIFPMILRYYGIRE